MFRMVYYCVRLVLMAAFSKFVTYRFLHLLLDITPHGHTEQGPASRKVLNHDYNTLKTL